MKVWQKIIYITKIILITIRGFFLVIVDWIKKSLIYYSRWDKVFIILFIAMALFSASLLFRQKYLLNTKLVASYGGIYKEGIIAISAADLKPVIGYLTKIGLVAFDKNGKIIPSLAESWEVSTDQKTYTFHLGDFVNPEDVVKTIKTTKNQWQNLEVKKTDEHSIEFVLSQPFSPFLASLSEHLFDYGPYKIKSEEKQKITFLAREDFYLGRPNISEIEIKIYPNLVNLSKALQSGELDGVNFFDPGESLPKDFTKYSFLLPRYQVLFFNLSSEVFIDNVKLRKKFMLNEKLDNEISVSLATNNTEKNLAQAQELKTRWAAIGVDVQIEAFDNKDLQSQVIPTRNYDLLLYGLDYGYDPDSYPFWHSSQITNTGLNLSNFSSVDADKILEEARQVQDETKRQELYDKLQQILEEELPAIFLSQEEYQYAISKKIQGVVSDHRGFISQDRYFEIWNWYIKEKRISK